MTAVGGLFFPQREALGLDSRELTPLVVERVVVAAAETRSFKRAAIVTKKVAGVDVSAKTIERVAGDVGKELTELRDSDDAMLVPSPEEPPLLAVVQCDGGRARTREPGHGSGVHGPAWRETKNACLVRMTHQTFETDPHPELPKAFRNPEHVAKIAEKEAPKPEEVAEILADALSKQTAAGEEEERADWRPKRLVRSCLSSMACSDDFGSQMARESGRRRFDEAPYRAFVGDGLPWNWSIWAQHYGEYVPILDFIHVLSYLYIAASSMASGFAAKWNCYLEMAVACWNGKVDEVIVTLEQWLERQGMDADESDAKDNPVEDARRYLTNNRERMDYARYRQQGLPITSALMESMVKEINYRVKGTEMFWNDPDGVETILQIRAAALCDDERLDRYLANRRGSQFVRRSGKRAA